MSTSRADCHSNSLYRRGFTTISDQFQPFLHVCFGMVILQASCHSLPKGSDDSIPVDVHVGGDLLKLSGGSPKHNVGLLHSEALGKLARDCKVTLSARCERPKEEKGLRVTLGYKDTAVKIVIYGLLSEIDLVNGILSDGDLFLQHPTQGDASVPYQNPQFLVAPGGEMPLIEEVNAGNVSQQAELDQVLDEPWPSEVFQAFDNVDGPVTFAAVEQSPRLQTKLKEYQIKALSMMTERERGVFEGAHFPLLWEVSRAPAGNVEYRHIITRMTSDVPPQPLLGGILADAMGLGKTLSVLALIAWYLDSPSRGSFSPRTTLVITTTSTIPGWEQQISKHFRPGQIRTAVFHGPTRHKLASNLTSNDIVLTTYETLRSEWSASRLNSILYQNHGGWARIVLDEAHHIRNRSSQIFQATCDPRARNRWCLTGTPIHNTVDDYAALLAFIKVFPFTGSSGKLAFAHWIDYPLRSHDKHEIGIRRLRKLIAATCLRRTKDHVQDQLQLPSRIEKVHHIDLSHEERKVYDFFKFRASFLVGKLGQKSQMDKTSWKTMLSIIGFLRSICNHGRQLLPQTALEMYDKQNTLTVDPVSKPTTPSEVSLSPPGISIDLFTSSPESPTGCYKWGWVGYQPSSKINALIGNIKSEQLGNKSTSDEFPIKSVIFSVWTKMLDLIEIALRENDISFQRIDGKASVGHRSLALKRFNEDLTCTVMLASIGAVAEGVDLTIASSVHLVEPQWNPMVEAQAVDRVHRIGQYRNVTITRYFVTESIENYVKDIQESKLRLVQQSFGDANSDQEKLKEASLQKLSLLLA
ncbi:hypothetical protein PMG11_04632 [Penicillium brasilianum]|uniref:Helicase n=1 Tax=Penicillium brasilianum TaxID=104259 RepID=A0A0F7VGI0_PENBI|nr:hypothetical protein PMG11_04632 [Penicillium brasilianum]